MHFRHIDSKDIQHLIEIGSLVRGPEAVSKAFDTFITKNYVWVDYTFDSIKWSAIESSISLNLLGVNEAELEDFINSTTLGNYELVCVIYSANEPCLITTLKSLLQNIDMLTRTVANTCYFFGIFGEGNNKHYMFRDFLEWRADDGFHLSGFLKKH